MAVADKPTGPFKDPLGKPLIARSEHACQVIDPMVFIDDDGSAYLYFGQGNCNVVKLNEDMISFDPSQVNRITPKGYNEGAFVIKRNGVYYLMWSSHDTRDPRYCVNYATGPSPTTSSTSARMRATTSGLTDRMKNNQVSALAVVSWPARNSTPS